MFRASPDDKSSISNAGFGASLPRNTCGSTTWKPAPPNTSASVASMPPISLTSRTTVVLVRRTPGVQTTSVQPNTRCGPSCSVARISTRLPSSFSRAAAERRARGGRAAAIADRRPQRVDVDVGRDLDLEDVAVDVLRHHRRARHERRRAIVDRVVGRAVVTVAGGAERAGHLPDRRAQSAVDCLRAGHGAIAADDDGVPFG